MPNTLSFYRLGRTDYQKCLELQRALVSARLEDKIGDSLLFTEHDPVVTVGRAFKEEEKLQIKDMPIVEVERGGKATYHGPGQMVGYPILALREGERDLHGVLRKIEDALIETLFTFQLQAEREASATGVWVEVAPNVKLKIASIGIAVRRWVTFHGFALNITTDLSGFQGFDPCGFKSNVMISLQHLVSPAPSWKVMETLVVGNVANAFGREPVEGNPADVWKFLQE